MTRSVGLALGALVLLNGLLSMTNLWPTPLVVPDLRVAPEAVLLWLLLMVLSVTRRPGPSGLPDPLGPRTLSLLAAVFGLLILGRYLDTTAPALFGRPVNFYWDLPQIPRFVAVSADGQPLLSAAVGLLVLACLGLGFLMIRGLIRQVDRVLVSRARSSPMAWALTLGCLALAIANYAGVRATWPYVSKPVIPTLVDQSVLLIAAWSADERDLLPPVPWMDEVMALPPERLLPVLAGRDFTVISMESFGAVLYDDAQLSQQVTPMRERFQRQLEADGWHVASAFFKAPTIGGGSDLSHLSLLSGLDLSVPRRHDLLLTTSRPHWVDLFRRAGYRTVGAYHAVAWDWPEHVFYRYDRYLDGPSMGYQGPDLTYWKIPDQAAVAAVEDLEPRTAPRQPRFLFMPTISCHFPFSPTPPFQQDWSRLLGPEPYSAEQVAATRAQKTNWLDLRPGYVSLVDYTFTWMGSYLTQPAAREAVYLLVGDHQPPSAVAGEGVPWDVPVWLVTRDQNLLQSFLDQGFAEGLLPPRAVQGSFADLSRLVVQVLQGEDRPALPTIQTTAPAEISAASCKAC